MLFKTINLGNCSQNIKFNSSIVILKIQLTTIYRKMHIWKDEGNMQFNLYLTWIPYLILLHNCYTTHYSHHKTFVCLIFTNHHCHILKVTNFLIFNIYKLYLVYLNINCYNTLFLRYHVFTNFMKCIYTNEHTVSL